MKRFLSVLLAIALLVSCAALPAIAEEKPTLTVGIPVDPNVKDYKDNDFTRFLEEYLDCNLEFVLYTSEYLSQLALSVAAKEKLPDVIIRFDKIEQAVVNEYGEDGYFIDLKPLIDEYCVNFWHYYDMLPEEDQLKIFAFGTDSKTGCMYGFPAIEEKTLMITKCMTYINAQWLENIGEDIPTTVDDLYRVLSAFANDDPNGNGIQDEVPVLGGAEGFMTDVVLFILNAFVHVDDDYYWNATDGQLWAPQLTDEYREAMIYLNKLYSEGLISPLYFTMSNPEVNPTIKNATSPIDGDSIVGMFTAVPLYAFTNAVLSGKDYVALPPLQDATGLGGYTPTSGNTPGYTMFITSSCENPELAIKFFDSFCDPQVFLANRYGVEGVHYELIDGTNYVGTHAQIHILPPPEGLSDEELSELVFTKWNSPSPLALVKSDPSGIWSVASVDDGSWTYWEYTLAGDCYRNTLAAGTPKEHVTEIPLTADELEALSDYAYLEYTKEARALFITGALDPNNDADWTNYLEVMKARGVYDAMEIYQSAYDRILAVK